MSICAYLITVAAGAEVILTLYGAASTPNYAEVFLKAILCIAIFQARGNVAHLLQPNSRLDTSIKEQSGKFGQSIPDRPKYFGPKPSELKPKQR
jgi:hypothetical protein